MSKITLRDYQKTVNENIYNAEERGIKRQLVVMATGAGKSFTITQVILDKVGKGHRILILVDMEDLVWQWKGYIHTMNPDIRIGIEKADHKAKMTDQIVIATPQTLGREGRKRIKRFKPDHFSMCVIDEAHRSTAETWLRVLNYFGFGDENFNDDNLLVGLSVGSESILELYGGVFGDGWTGSIEDAWNMASLNHESRILQGDYEFIEPTGVLARSFEDGRFVWKPIQKMIKHPADKDMYKLSYQGGDIDITNDHSVYVYDKDGNMKEKLTEDLVVGDVLVFDSPNEYVLNASEEIDVVDYCIRENIKRVHVSVDLSNITKEDIGVDSDKWYYYRRGVYGDRLPVKLYHKHRDKLPEPNFVYYEGGTTGLKTPIKIKPSDYAYLIGQYIGDGYVKGSGIVLCVNNTEVDYFYDYMEREFGDQFALSTKNAKGKSKEVLITNKLILSILSKYLNKGASNKKIHDDIIFSWDRNSKLKLLSGLLDSDGHLSIRERNKKNVTITTTSKDLKRSLLIFLKTLNIVAGSYKNPPSKGGVFKGRRIIGKRWRYDIKFSYYQLLGEVGNKKGNRYNYPTGKGVKITKIEKIKYDGFVYDIEMYGHPSFVANNILVHNTATPYRSDGVSLGGNFDDIVANYDIRYLMHNGWLTDIELYSVQTSTDLRKYTTQGEVDEAVNNEARNLEVLKTYLEFGGVDQFIGYTASVAHAYELTKLFNDNGIPSAVIEGETDKVERKETLQKYKDGEIRGLFNHSTLTTGTDLPETSMLMLLRPIKSKLTLTQTIGRGIRPSASASVDMFRTKEQRIAAIEMSEKPVCKIIDMYDRVQENTFTHIPSLFGLNNNISVDKGQRLFKEVVEPIEEAKNKHGIDPSSVLNINDISLIVKSRKLEIKSLTMDPEIEDFTDRVWITVSNGYEIIYGEDNKILLIEKDQTKSELINSEEWNLLEIDTKTNITKKLQTFKSLAGAFKIADEYADSNNWGSQFLKKNDWQEEGVTEKQMKMFERFFKYKSGYSKYELLDERYSDTNIRKIRWKDTGEVLTKGTASYILNDFFNSKKKK